MINEYQPLVDTAITLLSIEDFENISSVKMFCISFLGNLLASDDGIT